MKDGTNNSVNVVCVKARTLPPDTFLMEKCWGAVLWTSTQLVPDWWIEAWLQIYELNI
jgi:hypothetical protein